MKILIIIFVATLFISAIAFFIYRVRLLLFLSGKGVKIIFGLTGIPGYLETLYNRADNGVRDPLGDRIIKISRLFGIILLINVCVVVLLIGFFKKRNNLFVTTYFTLILSGWSTRSVVATPKR